MKSNDNSFYQLTKDELGEYNETIWLRKIHSIIQNYTKLRIGDNTFSELEKIQLKLIILYFNDTYKKLIFAWEPIKELTKEEVDTILCENHNEIIGHLGVQKTYQRIKEKYKIADLVEKVETFIKNCDACQKKKLTRIRPKEIPIISDTPLQPNDKIAMDIIGPMTKTKRGN